MSRPLVDPALAETIRRLTDQYVFEENPGGVLSVPVQMPEVPPASWLYGDSRDSPREYRRQSFHLTEQPATFDFLSVRPADRSLPQGMVQWGMEQIVQSVGVPSNLLAGTNPAGNPANYIATTTSAPSTEDLVRAMRRIRDEMGPREFHQEFMNEWPPPAVVPTEGLFNADDRQRASYWRHQNSWDWPANPGPAVYARVDLDEPDRIRARVQAAPPPPDTVEVDFSVRRPSHFIGVDEAQRGSTDRTMMISATVEPDGTMRVDDVREIPRDQYQAGARAAAEDLDTARRVLGLDVGSELAHNALREEMLTVYRGERAMYAPYFGHELSDDEYDFLDHLRQDLQAACPTQFIGITSVTEYLRRYEEFLHPLMRISVSDGQITAVERVVDSNGVETENVSVAFVANRNADVVTGEAADRVNDFTRRQMDVERMQRQRLPPDPIPDGPLPNRNGDVFDVGLLRSTMRDAVPAEQARQAADAHWRLQQAIDQMSEMLVASAPAALDAMRAELAALGSDGDADRRRRLLERIERIERDSQPAGRLPVLMHLVERRDMRELSMEEVRLWTGSARSDSSPEGLAYTRATSITPPPLYPGVQKAAWSSDEIAARQRSPQQRSDQVESLLARLREILVAKGHDPDLYKFTLNASAPLTNNCRVFVFRVLQTQGGDLIEVLCVRILQKINDRGSSDWGYQVTEGNPRRISRPLRPYVSRETLFREQQQAAREARQSGAAQQAAADRTAQQAEADRAAQERVARARAAAAARHQPPPVQSVQPDTLMPDNFRPGLDL